MYKKQGSSIISFNVAFAAVISLSLVTASCKVSGQSQQQQKGFVQIFDGKSLNGWDGDPTYWKAENGSLVGEFPPTTLLKTNNFVIWRGGKPGDFELTCDFKITKAGNRGINYR